MMEAKNILAKISGNCCDTTTGSCWKCEQVHLPAGRHTHEAILGIQAKEGPALLRDPDRPIDH